MTTALQLRREGRRKSTRQGQLWDHLAPRAVHSEWATNILATYSWTELAVGQDTCRFLRSPSAPALQGNWWVLACGSSHCSLPLHPQLGTRPAPFTGPTSRPLPPHCCYSSPHRTHHGVKDRLWTRRPRVTGAVLVLRSPPCSGEALNNARETVFRLCRKSCLRGTGSPSPLLNASDLTPRRGENTQDVFYCHFRGC